MVTFTTVWLSKSKYNDDDLWEVNKRCNEVGAMDYKRMTEKTVIATKCISRNDTLKSVDDLCEKFELLSHKVLLLLLCLFYLIFLFFDNNLG